MMEHVQLEERNPCGFCEKCFSQDVYIYIYYIGVFCFVCFLVNFLLIDIKYQRFAKM